MKLFASVLLAVIPIILGWRRKTRILLSGRIKAAFIRFAEQLHFEIEAFSRPQNQIFFRFEDGILERIGFLPRLRKEVEEEPCGALERALASFSEEICFSPLEEEAWTEFAHRFGMQSKHAQLKDCEKLLSILQKEEESAKEKRTNDAALAWTVGICVGVGLFILLI